LSWTVAALIVGVMVARTALVTADVGGPSTLAGVKAPESGAAGAAVEMVMFTFFAGIGGLLAARRPRNPIGWLLLTTGGSFALLLFSERLGWHYLLSDRVPTGRVSDWLWVANWAWIPAVVPVFIFLPLLFPTGRPLSPRWSRLARALAVVSVVMLVSAALVPGPLENYTAVDNPLDAPHAAKVISDVCFALLGAGALASVASLALRFRRSRGVERQQTKWVWAAGAVLVVSFVLSGLLQGPLGEDAAGIILYFGLLGVPVAVAVAILRYRLYDIAVVVNRTLVYGSLTAALALVYLASVLLLQLVLDPVTSGSSLAVAVSTLAVAGLFRPVRGRIQELVDRRFYRSKYDAARTLEAFSARLREELDLDTLSSELSGVLQETMQPAHVSLWLRPSGE
jgi:hypothetical protein